MTIKDLLNISSSDFNSLYREKELLYVSRGNERYYEEFLNSQILEDFFERDNLTYPFIRLIKHGKEIKHDNYIYPNTTNFNFNIIDKVKFTNCFGEGATIIIQKAHIQINQIKKICKYLSQELDAETQANIYISPAESQGFFPHIDTHDVIVLQIEGSKEWEIFDTPIKYPTGFTNLSEHQRNLYLSKTPSKKLTLKSGDALFIPRGMVHQAFSKSNFSTHITIGILPVLASDLLFGFSISIKDKEFSRKSLHQSNNVQVIEKLEKEFSVFLSDFSESRKTQNWQLIYDGNLFKCFWSLHNKINQEEVFKIVPDKFHVIKEIDFLRIKFNDLTLDLPSQFLPVIEFIQKSYYFKAKDISILSSESDIDSLLKTLLKSAFITINS